MKKKNCNLRFWLVFFYPLFNLNKLKKINIYYFRTTEKKIKDLNTVLPCVRFFIFVL